MNDQQNAKYVIHHAEKSAIGDYANVNNYISREQASSDPGAAELRRLFEDVNQRLAALEETEREMVVDDVEKAAKVAAELQQGDENPKKQIFLATRLKNIYEMAPDIGQVIIVTLASPAAGIALVIQKIAQKVQTELKQPMEPAENIA